MNRALTPFSLESTLSGILFFCCLPAWLAAQEAMPFFHHLTLQEELSEATNAYVYQDSRGFVWVSAVDGLNRFDGVSIRKYRPDVRKPRALFGQTVSSHFFEDAQGDIWFCTYGALNCYRRRSDDFDHWQLTGRSKGDTIGEDYSAFFLERPGWLWLHLGYGKKSHLYRFNIHTAKYEYLGPIFGDRCVADTNVQGQLRSTYSFQYGSPEGLYKTTLSPQGTVTTTRLFLPGATIHDVWIEKDTLVWVATQKGLVALNPTVPHSHLYALDVSRKTSIQAIKLLPSGFLALGSQENGLLMFDRKDSVFVAATRTQPGRASSLGSDAVDNLFLDTDHNLWISHWGYGLDFFNTGKPKIKPILLDSLFQSGRHLSASDKIEVLTEDKSGHLWIGTQHGGVFVCEDQEKSRLIGITAGLPQTGVLNIFCDRSGIIWVATSAGLFYRNQAGGRFQKINGQYKLHDRCTFQQSADGQILLSCDGFFSIKKRAGRGYGIDKHPIHPALDTLFCPYFYQDRKGNVYCNINMAATKVLKPDGTLIPLPFNNLMACYEDPDGKTIWLATSYGLVKLDQKTFEYTLFDESNGLPNQYLYGVVPDTKGFLWLPSNKGILRFDPSNNTTHQFTKADGIWEDAFVRNAALRRASGEIWMANRTAVNMFRPEDIHLLNILPKIQITNLKVNDLDRVTDPYIGECDYIELPFSENTISLNFVALEYSDPTKNRLSYRLMGHDRDWLDIPPGAPGFARYARLAPGTYTFQIKAANSDGIWTPKPKNLKIKIQPPFWQKRWFQIMMVLLLVLLVWGSIRLYVHRQLAKQRVLFEKQQALQAERNRIASELHDDLGQGLSKIKAISEATKQWDIGADEHLYLDKIWHSSMELIEKMRDIIWAMDAANDTLENLLYTIRACAGDALDAHRITASITIPEEIPAVEMSGAQRRNILLIVKECLHNIVKHSGATAVELHVAVDEGLTIQIRDNGYGFAKKTPDGTSGHGLRNMEKRARAAGGDLEISSSPGGVVVRFFLSSKNIENQNKNK